MKSKASFRSHPLHPILIPFPIAFFTGTLVAHIAGWALDNPDFIYTSYLLNIAGIVMAVVAAVPGLIDYIYTVPPLSSGKKRAAKHGLINSVMLLVFVGAAFYRVWEGALHIWILVLEIIGVGLMLVAGWMGGTLVHRNQIGVDHRYANAGKWNEAYFKTDRETFEVAKSDELKLNGMKLLHINQKRIVLARTEEGYVAFEDRCTHRGGSLAGGTLICQTVQCPWHGSQFSVRDGSVKAGPAKESIRTYVVSEKDGSVQIHLDRL